MSASPLRPLFAVLTLLTLAVGTVRAAALEPSTSGVPAAPATVRVCIIGGMTMTGLWNEIVTRFEADHPFQVQLVATGPLERITPAFRRGEADFLLMHSSDATIDLLADGHGVNMRPCARNDLVILGPPADPAGIKGLDDGAEALHRIATTESTFLDVKCSNGAQELGHTLWKRAGIRPGGAWFIQDEAPEPRAILHYASAHNAYFIFGRMPITQDKHQSGNSVILVDRDPTMRRPYVLMEANPARHPQVNQAGARALGDFILSEAIQTFMADYGKDKNGGFPFFYPVWPHGPSLYPSDAPAASGIHTPLTGRRQAYPANPEPTAAITGAQPCHANGDMQ